VNYQQDNWTDWLSVAEFQYNDKKHAVTGKTPFKLNFGRHPWKEDLKVQMEIPRVEEFVKLGTGNECNRRSTEEYKTAI